MKLESESSAERMCERKKRDDWFMEEVLNFVGINE